MHFQGKELISKGTTFTARSLLTVCFLKIFVYKFNIALGTASVAGVPIGKADLGQATNVLIYFLLVSHLISWIGDFLGFRNWNISEKMTGASNFDGAGEPRALISKLDSGLQGVKQLKHHADNNLGTTNSENLKTISKQVENVIAQLSNIKGGLRNLNYFAIFVLFFWYLLLPLVVSLFSINIEIIIIRGVWALFVENLNTIGLIIDIVGVVLLYKFALPSSAPDKGEGYAEDAPLTDSQMAKRANYKRLSVLSLFLIILGFVFQIASNYL